MKTILLTLTIWTATVQAFNVAPVGPIEIAPSVSVAPQLRTIPLTATGTINADVQPRAIDISTKFTKPLLDMPVSVDAPITASVTTAPGTFQMNTTFPGVTVMCNIPEGAIKIGLTVNGPLLGGKAAVAAQDVGFLAAHWEALVAGLIELVVFYELERRRLKRVIR